VEQVPARRQLPHRLAALHALQAHRAQRAALTIGGAPVRERRRHVDRRRANELMMTGAPGRPQGRCSTRGIVSSPPPPAAELAVEGMAELPLLVSPGTRMARFALPWLHGGRVKK
jgi:hypothetical protein